MSFVWFLFLFLCAGTADILPAPRRGATRGILFVVPGLNEDGLRSIVSNPQGSFSAITTSGDAYADERTLGMEIATGRGALENGHSIADSWIGSGRAVGAVTTSCILDPMITPFFMPYTASLPEAAQRVPAIAHLPRVWLGGRAANLRAMNLGKPPYCIANNTQALRGCAQKPPAGALYGTFGDMQSIFARRCMYVPADGPSLADMTAAAINELQGNDDGWFLAVYANDVDRAGHAMSVEKRSKALASIKQSIDVVQNMFATKNGLNFVFTIVSPYETGGFNGTAYTSAVHSGSGAVYTSAGAAVEPLEETTGFLGPRNIAGIFAPGLSAAFDAHPLSFIIQKKPETVRNKEPRIAWIFLGSLSTVLLVAVSYAINSFSSSIKKSSKLKRTVG